MKRKYDEEVVLYIIAFGSDEKDLNSITGETEDDTIANMIIDPVFGEVNYRVRFYQINDESEVDSLNYVSSQLIKELGGEGWWMKTATIRDTWGNLKKNLGLMEV